MANQLYAERLSASIKPVCPRDGRVMRYEVEGIAWNTEKDRQTVPSYHCGYQGCSVRYAAADGYFTVIDMPDLPIFVEEPGINLLRCPRHGTWLYRSTKRPADESVVWRCGVSECDYASAAADTSLPGQFR